MSMIENKPQKITPITLSSFIAYKDYSILMGDLMPRHGFHVKLINDKVVMFNNQSQHEYWSKERNEWYINSSDKDDYPSYKIPTKLKIYYGKSVNEWTKNRYDKIINYIAKSFNVCTPININIKIAVNQVIDCFNNHEITFERFLRLLDPFMDISEINDIHSNNEIFSMSLLVLHVIPLDLPLYHRYSFFPSYSCDEIYFSEVYDFEDNDNYYETMSILNENDSDITLVNYKREIERGEEELISNLLKIVGDINAKCKENHEGVIKYTVRDMLNELQSNGYIINNGMKEYD